MSGNDFAKNPHPKPLSPIGQYILVKFLGLATDTPENPADKQDVGAIAYSLLSWILLIVSWFIVLACLTADLQLGNNSIFYFQRSGAILVLASFFVEVRTALLSEYQLNAWMFLARHAPSLDLSELGWDRRTDRFRNVDYKFRVLGWISSVVGTMIWAFGDVAFRVSL